MRPPSMTSATAAVRLPKFVKTSWLQRTMVKQLGPRSLLIFFTFVMFGCAILFLVALAEYETVPVYSTTFYETALLWYERDATSRFTCSPSIIELGEGPSLFGVT